MRSIVVGTMAMALAAGNVTAASARAGRVRTFKAVDGRDKADAEQKLRVMGDNELRLHRNDLATPNRKNDGYDDERLARAAEKRARKAARRGT